jgi:hypothetical protein
VFHAVEAEELSFNSGKACTVCVLAHELVVTKRLKLRSINGVKHSKLIA